MRKVEIAGPGFINFFLAEAQLASVLEAILAAGERYGRSDPGNGVRVNVEFVSANPTGPLHVGHGRGAALGDAIAALLEGTGHAVVREFYVNDAGTQIDKLARSLWARVQQRVGRDVQVPEGGYHGDYLIELAEGILAREGRAFADLPQEEGIGRCRSIGVLSQRAEQDEDLREFGVKFDVIYFESELYRGQLIERTLADLTRRGYTYEQDGALWLRTTAFGDDKDRVLRKSDGTYTYLLPDIAYHRHKRERGFARAIDVWGADHHGYVPRLQAGMKALGYPEDFFHAEIVQLVRVMRGGEEVRFSKRTGDFVMLRDLFEDMTFYENKADSAIATKRPDGSYAVHLVLQAKKLKGDSLGNTRDVPIADYVDIGIFGERIPGQKLGAPLLVQKVHITQNPTVLDLIVAKEPMKAGIDPYNKLIDRTPEDNVIGVVRR